MKELTKKQELELLRIKLKRNEMWIIIVLSFFFPTWLMVYYRFKTIVIPIIISLGIFCIISYFLYHYMRTLKKMEKEI